LSTALNRNGEGTNINKRKWQRVVSVLAMLAFLVSFFVPGTGQAHAASFVDYKIEINKTTNKLYLYKNGSVVKVYPVATGRTNSLTPEGTFPIVVKIVNPGWRGIPGGSPDNPLGARWNGLSVHGDNGRTYGIHGTNNPGSIGKHVSHGCVRMYNQDVIELYNTIYEGTPVWIHSGTSDNHWRGDPSVGLKPASGTAKITGDNVNARTGPSTGSFVIQKLRKGTTLPVTGKSGDWVQVKLPSGRLAFVHKDYVSLSGGGNTPPSSGFKPASGKVTVTVDVANVRAKPSLSSTILFKAKRGTTFTLTADNGEWFQIRLSDGRNAYLHHSVAKVSASVTVTAGLANVRSGPYLSAKLVARVPQGTTFTKIGISGDFHQVLLKNGTVAYIHISVAK
jgi:SH3-like domain-containing protein